jgi:hypothetical protein|tara:strand:- start:148 stop:375 length:228 start_codon:yes stop_codon:yes gene_type:complete
VTTLEDIVFDEICSDVFPKLARLIGVYLSAGFSDTERHHGLFNFLTDDEGYHGELALKILDAYEENKHRKELCLV